MMRPMLVVFFLESVAVASQSCYSKCLQEATRSVTTLNVLLVDGEGSVTWAAARAWYDMKTAQFNALHPAIAVTPVHVHLTDFVDEALRDLEQQTNTFHAYVTPFLNLFGGTSRLADRLMDMSEFTVGNVNNVSWHRIGRFFRSHAALYGGKVLTLPLTGDFFSLWYRRDIFERLGMTVPRTLQEYVLASQLLNGTDLNGDGDVDYGSCFSHVDELSEEVLFAWLSQVLQYRGTSQGSILDTETLEPLLENPAVQEAMRLWREVAGVTELTSVQPYDDMLRLWSSGRCALTIAPSSVYTFMNEPGLHDITGTAVMPGSEKVWWREGNQVVKCNTSFCRHATRYEDGAVVNHAPFGQTVVDGAINGQIERERQLAAFTYLTWLMNDDNMVEAVLAPGSWPNFFPGSFVKPSLLVPSVWSQYGWSGASVSMVDATATSNVEHPNAFIGLRLPNAVNYLNEVRGVVTPYWRNEPEYQDLDQNASSVLVSALLAAQMEEVTDSGDRQALVVAYQKSLQIYQAEPIPNKAAQGDLFPSWAIYSIVGILSFPVCSGCLFGLCWFISTVRKHQKHYLRQKEAWDSIVDQAENYTGSLGCPMALVSAAHFFDLGCLTKFETLRDEGKQRVLDTVEKVVSFQETFFIVFLSHQWLTCTVPDPDAVHFTATCAAVKRASQIAHVSLDRIFLWMDYSSIPQDGSGSQLLHRSLFSFLSFTDHSIHKFSGFVSFLGHAGTGNCTSMCLCVATCECDACSRCTVRVRAHACVCASAGHRGCSHFTVPRAQTSESRTTKIGEVRQ